MYTKKTAIEKLLEIKQKDVDSDIPNQSLLKDSPEYIRDLTYKIGIILKTPLQEIYEGPKDALEVLKSHREYKLIDEDQKNNLKNYVESAFWSLEFDEIRR